jgi:hypothetical protein
MMNGSFPGAHVNRRSRMVSFRLSPEEYEKLQNVCAAEGVRSLSELARTALQRMIVPRRPGQSFSREMGDMRLQIATLRSEIDRLSQAIEERRVET